MSVAAKTLSIDEMRERLAPLFKEAELQIVLLFGSLASKKGHRESDIDLAFLFDRPIDILSLTNKVIQLLHDDHVDVIDLRRGSPILNFSAARQGRVLYERSEGLFHAFYSLAFRRYADTRKMRDARGKTIKKFLERKGLI